MEQIILRNATEADWPLIMAWRSSPLVYAGFYTQKQPLGWKEHTAWLNSRFNWREFIILLRQDENIRPIGIVTLGQLDHWSPEIGYFIGEVSLWGKGYGKEAVEQGMEWLKRHGYEYCHTTVLCDNERSIGLLKSLGFEEGMNAREGEFYYQRKL